MASDDRDTTICREGGCEEPRLRGLYFCAIHATKKRRCRKVRDGERCKKAAMTGLFYCNSHTTGGGQREVSARTKAVTKMERFVRPFAGDVDPITVFEQEFRRTLGRIAWLDDQIAELGDDDLVWGMTKRERLMASETPGTNTTYEARVNLLVEMQNWERKHLLDLEKVWIGAKLDTERLSLMRRYVETTYTAVVKALVALGLDPASEEVQAALTAALLTEEPRGVPVLGPIGGDDA